MSSVPTQLPSGLTEVGFEQAQSDLELLQKEVAKREKTGRELKKLLHDCSEGTGNWAEYEQICKTIIETCLKDDIPRIDVHLNRLPRVRRSEHGKKPDLMFLNTVDQGDSFWAQKFRSHGSRRIVLECKNYSKGKISYKEVYQTFHYLSNESGRFGIILTRKDCKEYKNNKIISNSAYSAIRRLHNLEPGFMVWVIGDKELKDLIDAYVNNDTDGFFFAQEQIFMEEMQPR